MVSKRGRCGFSLVETLMVVAVIGIIASIAIPLLLNARRTSLDEKARGSMRSLVSAQQSFFAAHGRFGNLGELTSASPAYLDTRFTSADGLGQGISLNVSTSDRGLRFTALAFNPGGNTDFLADESFVVRPADEAALLAGSPAGGISAATLP